MRLDGESMAVAINNGTEDMREAFRAFKERREPAFRGR